MGIGLTIAGPEPLQSQPRKLKVHISVDMEGVAGVVTGDQLGPTGFEYGRFREFMTREAVEVSFKHYLPAEVLAYLPLFERTSAYSVRFRARDMVEAASIMEFVGEYRPDLTP